MQLIVLKTNLNLRSNKTDIVCETFCIIFLFCFHFACTSICSTRAAAPTKPRQLNARGTHAERGYRADEMFLVVLLVEIDSI